MKGSDRVVLLLELTYLEFAAHLSSVFSKEVPFIWSAFPHSFTPDWLRVVRRQRISFLLSFNSSCLSCLDLLVLLLRQWND